MVRSSAVGRLRAAPGAARRPQTRPSLSIYSPCCPLTDHLGNRQDVPAFILAGGVGSRLNQLTAVRPKPMVPFAGHHRLIDFTLSNCVNSGITDVTLLTQYLPAPLEAYVGNGRAWGLDGDGARLRVLRPPDGGAYEGTADAVRQRMPDSFGDASAVLVLAADHVYAMDYQRLVARHLATGADITLAVIDVPLQDANRFGIVHVAPDGSVVRFVEKPRTPSSTLASMGIYVFDPLRLRHLLAIDAAEPTGHDFGHDILPLALALGLRVQTFPFTGYWRDVGTPESYWAAHRDLLAARDEPLAAVLEARCMHAGDGLGVSMRGVARDSAVLDGCRIEGIVERSVLAPGVRVGRGAVVRDSILLAGARVEEGAVVDHAVLDEGSVVARFASVGVVPSKLPSGGPLPAIAVVGAGARVAAGQALARGGSVGPAARPAVDEPEPAAATPRSYVA